MVEAPQNNEGRTGKGYCSKKIITSDCFSGHTALLNQYHTTQLLS